MATKSKKQKTEKQVVYIYNCFCFCFVSPERIIRLRQQAEALAIPLVIFGCPCPLAWLNKDVHMNIINSPLAKTYSRLPMYWNAEPFQSRNVRTYRWLFCEPAQQVSRFFSNYSQSQRFRSRLGVTICTFVRKVQTHTSFATTSRHGRCIFCHFIGLMSAVGFT